MHSMLDCVWKYTLYIVCPLPVTFLSPAHKGSQMQTWRQEPVCCFDWSYFFLWLKEENKVQVVLTRREEQRQMDWLVSGQTDRQEDLQGDRRVHDEAVFLVMREYLMWSMRVSQTGGMKFWGRQKIMSPTSTRNNTRNVSGEDMYQWSWRDNLAKTASQVERRVDWQQVRRETRCCSTVMWMWRKDGREWQENNMEPVRV